MLLPMIGKNVELVNAKMINELGIQPQPVKKTILDTAYSLIELGLVEKKSKYNGTPMADKIQVENQEESKTKEKDF